MADVSFLRARRVFVAFAAVLLTLALMALGAFGQSLDTAGIPASAKGVFFLDAAPESPFGAALREILLQKLPTPAEQETEIGFAPTRDVRGVVIAILPALKKANQGKELTAPAKAADAPRGVLLLRGKFNFADVLLAAEKRNFRPVLIGERKFVDAGFLGALQNFSAKPQGGAGKVLLGSVAPKILVLADADGAGESVAAFDAPEKAWRVPDALAKLLQGASSPILLGSVEQSLFPKLDLSVTGASGEIAPSVVRLLFSEIAGMLRLQIEADFVFPDDARRAGAQIKTLLDFQGLEDSEDAGGSSKEERAAAQRRRERLNRFCRAVQFQSSGKTLRITAEYPAADALALLREQM